ncbi:colicin V production protein [Candidatus Viridilinea mediisalina]|uniref:Colicin V production protein n=2 Tax=Candidatus Viridilinea mediisalina TaxID=2024553 RepID=A0A2A6RFN0_9CHLR|nr:colicin V production protein [Candidatus Viridilinea mediisalina]
MNFIDILLVFLFFGTLAAGFFQGMIRLLIVIVALYLATVLASLYFAPLGDFFVRQFQSQRYVSQYIAFALVHMISLFLITIAGLYTFRYAKLPGSLEYLDRIVGTLLGMVLGALIIGMTADLLWNLMVTRGGRNVDMPIFRMIGNSVANSFVCRYFATVVLPLTFDYFAPFLPSGARMIFAIR